MKKYLKALKRIAAGFIDKNFEFVSEISRAQKFGIGASVKGEPLTCFKIGNGATKILFVSAIHGNEIGTVKLAHNIGRWFFQNKDNFKNLTLFVIPHLNPDGYKRALKSPDYKNGGQVGRFNANSVDLNRNFDTKNFTKESVWSFGKNYSKTREVFCGECGNSEPETKALTDFIKSQDIKILFILHSVGLDVMPGHDELSQKLARAYAQKANFRLVTEGEIANLKQTGTARDWCEENNISYIEVEASQRYGSDWQRQKEAIKLIFKILNEEKNESKNN